MAVIGDPDGYRLAYEAGLHAVAEQASTLRETRDRAGALLSVAAVSGGLAAGLYFTDDRSAAIGPLGVLGVVVAVLGFFGIVLATVMIWRPMEGQFVHDAGVIVGSYLEGDPPADLPELHRELALWLGDQADFNRGQLSERLKWFNRGLLFLPVEVVGVIVVLGDAARGQENVVEHKKGPEAAGQAAGASPSETAQSRHFGEARSAVAATAPPYLKPVAVALGHPSERSDRISGCRRSHEQFG